MRWFEDDRIVVLIAGAVGSITAMIMNREGKTNGRLAADFFIGFAVSYYGTSVITFANPDAQNLLGPTGFVLGLIGIKIANIILDIDVEAMLSDHVPFLAHNDEEDETEEDIYE